LALAALLIQLPSAVAADTSFSATQVIPVPPASTYQGSGGGDGWAVALTNDSVYNVFHHSASLEVACHYQTDASSCWSPKTITDESGVGFATSNHPGLWLDATTQKLYVYATQAGTSTGGVVCIDTSLGDVPNPFCGFTPLSNAGDSSESALGSPVLVDSRWYAFNYMSGRSDEGTANHLLCFDTETLSACDAQPYAVTLGSPGTVDTGSLSPIPAAIGDEIVIPIRIAGADRLACFDTVALANCGGAWPGPIASGYIGNSGAPFPLLTADGSISGTCLPTADVPCYGLDGSPTASPPGLSSAITPSSPYNGEAFVLGARAYVPNGNQDQVQCYNFLTQASCAGFPRGFSNLGYLYTVNKDPQRPTCVWVNADNGAGQIQNFDAYTGGACGEGPIRVLASSIVVDSPECTPTTYTSLTVLEPTRDRYSSGSVAFEDGDATPIPGVEEVQLDGSGNADLTGLELNTDAGLPQFLITLLDPVGTPGSVTVRLTWVGKDDPSCNPDEEAQKLKLVSLGDSYSSGEGTFNYDNHKEAQKCHRGPDAWPRLLEQKTVEVVEIDHRACTGAKTNNLKEDYRGNPPQIPSTPDPEVDLVVLTIGGNDVGFAGILFDCVLPGGTCADDPESKGFNTKLDNLYRNLVNDIYPKVIAAYPNARIMHVGYPRLTPQPGIEPYNCGWLGEDEQEAGVKMAEKLNGTIYGATQRYDDVDWIDVTDVLDGHELCTRDTWMEPLYIRLSGSERGHPRYNGQYAYAQRVAAALGLTWLILPEF
jgi:lysophospholipase L1-like esterase